MKQRCKQEVKKTGRNNLIFNIFFFIQFKVALKGILTNKSTYTITSYKIKPNYANIFMLIYHKLCPVIGFRIDLNSLIF